MTTIEFITAEGTSRTVDATDGDTLMQTALSNNIEEIVGECGGSMMCSTCHCYIDAEWIPETGERSEEELDMLGFAVSDVTGRSRLSCQVTITPSMNGMKVYLPESQI